MKRLNFETLTDVRECYGAENLIAVDTLKQILHYSRNGLQPVFVCESEREHCKGKLVAWYLKSEESYFCYRKWMADKPKS